MSFSHFLCIFTASKSLIKQLTEVSVINIRCQCQRSFFALQGLRSDTKLTFFLLCLFFFFCFVHSAQGELEMPARAQGRFQTVLACKAGEQQFMYRAKRYSVGGSLFCFVILNTTDVNSFLRDLIYTDLHGWLVQQHPCGKCQFNQYDHCNYWRNLSVLWMYKLHNNIYLLSEISSKTYEELCKFPKEFALKIISAYV